MSIQYSLLESLEQKLPMGVSEPAKIIPFEGDQGTSHLEELEKMAATSNGADAIIKMACRIVDSKLGGGSECLTSPDQVKRFFKARLAGLEHEVFAVAFLNTKHVIVGFEIMFRGTINGASVYTREVVKEALRYNCSAVLFSHNHPSGDVLPSRNDFDVTCRLKNALELVDVRVLDHLIVGCGEPYSMAENQQI